MREGAGLRNYHLAEKQEKSVNRLEVIGVRRRAETSCHFLETSHTIYSQSTSQWSRQPDNIMLVTRWGGEKVVK